MGCRPYWLPVDPSPACETSGQVYRHLASYRHLSMLDGGSLVTETRCRRPCTYMEYKVQGLDCLLTAMYCVCAQLAEDPVFVNLAPGLASEAQLTVVLVSSSVEVSASKSSIRRFVITEKAPTRAFSWLKAATTAFTFKTLC